MLSKLYKKYSIVLLLTFFTITAFSQTQASLVALDSIIIKKNANLILDYELDSEDVSKKGIDYTVNYYDNSNENRYSLFNIPVESIEVILIDNALISLEIKLEENNDQNEQLEKKMIKYLGNFDIELSKISGSQKRLFFGKKDIHFILNSSSITETNVGHLSVAYTTPYFIELNKQMKQNN